MSAPTPAESLSQKEYLKKYLGYNRAPGEKKRKKHKKGVSNRVTIIDDDAYANAITVPDEDPLQANEDAPQIVAIIDERPPSMRVDEKTNSHLWRPIGAADDNPISFDGKRLITGFKIEKTDPVSESLRKDRDKSPPRKKKNKNQSPNAGSSSPLVDIKVEVESPPRETQSHHSPSREDISPRRRRANDDQSPVRRRNRDLHKNDFSPPRRHRNDTERRRNEKEDIIIEDQSPPRKRRTDDISPPRRKKKFDESSSNTKKDRYHSPSRRNKRFEDSSPPRRRRSSRSRSPFDKSKRNGHNFHSRNNRNDNGYSEDKYHSSRKHEGSSRKKERDDSNSRTSSGRKSRWQDDAAVSATTKEEPPEENRPSKTLDGKTAGLQNSRDLTKELVQTKTRENHYFHNLSKDISGENAQAVQRDRRTGKVRNFQEEEEAKRKKEAEEQKQKEKYARWGKGLTQVESREQKLKEEIYEMSKPLARYADDEDLERLLKEQEREGDPMLKYIRSKKKKKAVEAGVPQKPQFEGEFMPNRFGIRPGHRWDGVDRSNGYEKKWFEVINEKRAQIEEVYKWSTEDM